MTEIHFQLIAFGLLAIVFSMGAGFSLARRDYVDVFIFLTTSNMALLLALIEVRKL
jgi:hypothetical protein